MPPLVELENVTRTFHKSRVEALRGVNLDILRGDSVAIVGPSGSGKSTLLQLLGAMDQPTTGAVRFEGVEPRHRSDCSRIRARLIGFVFQSFQLLPNLTALENVQIPMIGVVPRSQDRLERAQQLLGQVGLGDRVHHRPLELSGGEQQRVAIARSLANDPPLLLADEPTGNLDSRNSEEILDLLLELKRVRGNALVLVTHEKAIADRFDSTIHFLDGRIQSRS